MRRSAGHRVSVSARKGCVPPSTAQGTSPALVLVYHIGAGLSLLMRRVTRATQGPEPALRTHFAL